MEKDEILKLLLKEYESQLEKLENEYVNMDDIYYLLNAIAVWFPHLKKHRELTRNIESTKTELGIKEKEEC